MNIAFILGFASTGNAQEKGGGAAEMARKLQDPLANISAFMTDNDIQFRSGEDEDTTSYSFQLQPVYAFDFPDRGFTFIPRAAIPVIGAASGSNLKYTGETPKTDGAVWGMSDIVTQFFSRPKLKGHGNGGWAPNSPGKREQMTILAVLDGGRGYLEL